MAIYRLSLSVISRSDGRSATAAAAYRAAERIEDRRTGLTYNYRRKSGVVRTGLVGWAGERAELWNAVEESERRRNSRVARELQLALPREVGESGQWELAHGFAGQLRERYGVAVDVSLHDQGDGNPHAHLLFTTRRVEDDGEIGKKTRILDDRRTGPKEVEALRAAWADAVNDGLARAGEGERVDHRSLAAQGLDRAPLHIGRGALAMEERGHRTDQGDRLRIAYRKNQRRSWREVRDGWQLIRARARRQRADSVALAGRAGDEFFERMERAAEGLQNRVLDLLEAAGASQGSSPAREPQEAPQAPPRRSWRSVRDSRSPSPPTSPP